MVDMNFIRYFFLIQCIIFHNQCKFVMAIYGPTARQANINEFPSLVAIIGVDDSNITEIELYQSCTGTLISKQDILTAEHCLRTTFTEGFSVLAGSVDLRQSTVFYPMFVLSYEQWILYKQRTLQSDNHDISIIKLLDSVPQHILISPIGNIENNLLYGLHCEVTGWGTLTNGTKPRFLHTATVTIITKDECKNKLYTLDRYHYNIDDKVLCTIGNPFAVLGHGDSGGPLTFFGTIVGINHAVLPSYHDTTRPDQINLHLNLRFYSEFIQDVLTRFRMHL